MASSDEATARQNREIFTVAAAEGWRLVDQGTDRKVLVIGNEGWPFPVPIVKSANSWRFDTAAGKEEVLARRIGRNELAAIGTCHTYVDGSARLCETGTRWKARGLVCEGLSTAIQASRTACIGRPRDTSHGARLAIWWRRRRRKAGSSEPDRDRPSPFHGYYFKILTGQGKSATGGAKSYLVKGEMSGGFALVAWPAQYDASGVMTFIVNQDGVVHEKDLGVQTEATVAAMTVYNPDASWRRVQ